MKTNTLLAALVLAEAASLLSGPAVVAGLPQPMCVYYGQARDGYGLPYRTNADVVLLKETTEIARQPIRGSLAAGVNFALYVHLDSGGTDAPYSGRALRAGDIVSIVVRDPEGQKTVMENQAVPPVGQPGDLVLIHVTASEDTDRDGLPDTWERELMAWSGGKLRTLADVRPGDDFDGDGVSNLQEYQAGTFAFLNYDYLSLERPICTPNGRLQLTFLSVPGKVYSLLCATNLAQAVWTGGPFSLSDAGPPQASPVEGTGDWVSVYIPVETPARFFRLEAQ